MTDIDFDSFGNHNVKSFQGPSMAIYITVSSLFVAFLYASFLDFSKSYVKAPKHIPPRGWLVTFRKPRVDAPLIELRNDDHSEALERGSRIYPDKPYRIPHHPNEWVIIPYKMIDEIKNLPESKLSFQQGSYDLFMGWHTDITNHERTVANILRSGVNRIIDVVYAAVQDESLRSVLGNIGPCEDWTEISLLPKAVNMIMAISQRVFVGEPLCRSEDWPGAIRACDLFENTEKKLSGTDQRHAFMDADSLLGIFRLLKPVLEKRLADMDSPDFKGPSDLMQFVIDATKRTGEGRSLDYQVNAIISTGRAALFTTGNTIYHLIYELAIHTEYIEPLRQELKELGDVPMTRENVFKLVKLDSFIRESQRWRKFLLVSAIRKVMSDLALSDGTKLPAGTHIAINVQNANIDNSTLENPNDFDGFRFERLRQLEGNAQLYQSGQTAPDHLVYGIGSQACPGRFFAAHEARVVTAHILLNYDFKLKRPYPHGHPMDRANGIMTIVDPNVEFQFKRRDPKM